MHPDDAKDLRTGVLIAIIIPACFWLGIAALIVWTVR